MANPVEEAIYRLRSEGKEEADALKASVDALAASEERLAATNQKVAGSNQTVTMSEEKVTRATRTRADSMDRLLGRLDPRVRAEQQLQATLAQINRFEEEGIGSVAQRAQAVAAATNRYADAMQRIKGTKAEGTFLAAGNAAKLSAFQVQNLTFQLNDIATMLASGQSPFVLLMQQGMQIAQIFGPGVGVAGALKATGGALMSFIANPLTLTVIGIAAAAGAVKLFFDAISSGGRDAEGTLKNQEELVKRIKDRFGEADGAAKRYQETLASLQFSQRGVAEDLAKLLKAQLQPLRNLDLGIGSGAARQYADDQMQAMFEATAKFVDEIRAGRGDVLAFNKQIEELANSDPADKALQKYARRLREATSEATKTAEAIRALSSSMLANMDVAGRLASHSALAQQDMANYAKFANEQRVTLERLNAAHAAELAAIGAKSPAQKQAAAEAQERISLLGQEITAEEKAARIANAGAKARAQAEYEISEALRQRVMGMDESVAAAELEIQKLGMTAGGAARLTTAFQLLTAAKKAAIESGTVVSEAEIAKIMETAEAIGELTDKLTRLGIARDLAFEHGLIGLTPEDVAIAQRLRALYGDDITAALNSAEAAAIRLDNRLKLMRDIAYERGLIGLTDKEVAIAQRLRNIYGDDIPAALNSAEAEALRLNDRMKEIADAAKSVRDSFQGAIEGVFSGGIRTAGEFLDKITGGIANAFAKLAAQRLTDKLFGGALAPVDAAGNRVAVALTGAATKVQAATPPLNTAASSLNSAATNLKSAATALTAAGGGLGTGMAPGGWTVGAVGAGGILAQGAAAAKFNLAAAAQAIKNIESSGGNYGVMGSVTRSGDRAYGAYQVMGNNIREWTKAALGFSMSSQEFLRSQDAQDKVFAHRFGILVEKYGNVADAASAWFTGGPLKTGANKADMHGTTGSVYVDRFMRDYNKGGPAPAATAYVANDNVATPSVNIAAVGGTAVSSPAEIGGLTPTSPVGGTLTKLGSVLSSPLFQQAVSGFSMGYQSQSPVMGGLGGAFSGLLAGGPVGALVGGVTGIIGGIFGKSRAQREEEERAKAAWKAMAEEVAAFSDELRGKVTGTLGDTIRAAEARFNKYKEAAEAAGEGTGKLARELDQFRKRSIREFRDDLPAIRKSLRSGLGDDDPFRKAAQGIEALRKELLGLVADAKLAGANVGRVKGDARDLVLAQIGGGRELSEYEAEVRRIKGTKEAAIDLLVELGMKEKKARQAVNAQIKLAIEAAQEIINERRLGFQDRVFAAMNDLDTLEGQLAAFDRQAQRERERELKAGGEAMADLEKALAAERLRIQEDFNKRAIEEARRAQDELNRSARSIAEYINDLLAGPGSTLSPQDRFNAAQIAYNEQLALAQGGNAQALAGIAKFAENLRTAAREMFASGPQYQDIQNQIIQQLTNLPAFAQTDDPVVLKLTDAITAITGITAAVNLMRTSITDALAAGPAATAAALAPHFDSIDIDVSGGITLAEMQTALGTTNARLLSIFQELDTNGDGQITKLELIAARTLATQTNTTGVAKDKTLGGVAKDATLTGVNGLKGINDKVNGVAKDETLTSDSKGPKWAKNTALATVAFAKAVAPWIPLMAYRLWEISDGVHKKGVIRGEDRALFASKAKTKTTKLSIAGWQAQGGVIGGYEPGGIVGNGIWNVDSVRARYAGGGDIMLAGGEFVTRAPSVNAMTMPILDAINRTGRAPMPDMTPNFQMLARVMLAASRAQIEALSSEVAMLRAAVARGNDNVARAVREKPVAKPQPKVA